MRTDGRDSRAQKERNLMARSSRVQTLGREGILCGFAGFDRRDMKKKWSALRGKGEKGA